MKSLELIWTALPGGWSGTDLLLSVHISPRLKDDAAPAGTMYTVNDFPDLLNWPAQKISYNVFLSRQSDPPGTPPRGPFPATVVTSPAPSSQLYQGLFKSGGFVQPRTFDSHLADQIQVRSY